MLSDNTFQNLHQIVASKGYDGSLDELKNDLEDAVRKTSQDRNASIPPVQSIPRHILNKEPSKPSNSTYPFNHECVVIWFGHASDGYRVGFLESELPCPGKVINKAYTKDPNRLASVVLHPLTKNEFNHIRSQAEKQHTIAWFQSGEKPVSSWYAGRHQLW